MPNYADPLSKIGAVSGAASGGILGRLSSLLEPLDYPRQSLYNLGRSIGRGVSGEGSWEDVLSALPGALGAGLTGGLAATGAGLPLALLAGSALGGTAQGVGKAVAPDQFEAPTAQDLAEKLTGDKDSAATTGLGLGIGIATDPLTYAGGLGGSLLGKIGGKRLENTANWLGPQYAGGVEKLASQMGKDPVTDAHIIQLMNHPDLKSMLGELRPGSYVAGRGAETPTFAHPESAGVVQFGKPSSMTAAASGQSLTDVPPHRPDLPELLQSARSRPFPIAPEQQRMMPDVIRNIHTGGSPDVPIPPVRVEHNPMVQMGDKIARQGFGQAAEADAAQRELGRSVGDRGYGFWDPKPANIGQLASGEYKITDAGAVSPLENLLTSQSIAAKPAESLVPSPGTAIERWLLNRLGAKESIRGELEAKLAAMGGRTPGELASALRPPLPPVDEEALMRGIGGGDAGAVRPGSPIATNNLGPAGVHVVPPEQIEAMAKQFGAGGRNPADMLDNLKQMMWQRQRG